jgi:hypothetical protein
VFNCSNSEDFGMFITGFFSGIESDVITLPLDGNSCATKKMLINNTKNVTKSICKLFECTNVNSIFVKVWLSLWSVKHTIYFLCRFIF